MFGGKGRFTWTSIGIEDTLYFCSKRTTERSPNPIFFWQTTHPLLMRINDEPYRDDLWIITEAWERYGILISRPISLDDIEILYASHICKIDDKTRKEIEERIREEAERWKNYDWREYFQKDDALVKYEMDKNRNFVGFLGVRFSNLMANGLEDFTEEQVQAGRRFFESLRKVLRE